MAAPSHDNNPAHQFVSDFGEICRARLTPTPFVLGEKQELAARPRLWIAADLRSQQWRFSIVRSACRPGEHGIDAARSSPKSMDWSGALAAD